MTANETSEIKENDENDDDDNNNNKLVLATINGDRLAN